MTDKTLDGQFAQSWIDAVLTAFSDRRNELGDLDRQIGDGDFADNIASALAKASKLLSEERPTGYGPLVGTISAAFLDTGGTSGPLLGMWFRDLSRAGDSSAVSVAEFSQALTAAVATVQRLGHAKVGDKTMVDAMVPAAEALAEVASQPAAQALAHCAEAAEAGADSTQELVAHRGRASYVGDLARDVLDPGAAFIALVFRSAADVLA